MSATNFVDEDAVKSVKDFLKTIVPRSHIENIESELKKEFVLTKKRSSTNKKKKKNKKKITLTRKEKKALGFYSIPRKSVKFEDVLPMHHIWSDYMSQMLDLDKLESTCDIKNWENFSQTVYKADFHGSMLSIVRSKCPSYVGKEGICIMDTKNTFKIVSKDNVVTTIPKSGSVFMMSVKNVNITLFGKLFAIRPAERSKKVKNNLHPDL